MNSRGKRLVELAKQKFNQNNTQDENVDSSNQLIDAYLEHTETNATRNCNDGNEIDIDLPNMPIDHTQSIETNEYVNNWLQNIPIIFEDGVIAEIEHFATNVDECTNANIEQILKNIGTNTITCKELEKDNTSLNVSIKSVHNAVDGLIEPNSIVVQEEDNIPENLSVSSEMHNFSNNESIKSVQNKLDQNNSIDVNADVDLIESNTIIEKEDIPTNVSASSGTSIDENVDINMATEGRKRSITENKEEWKRNKNKRLRLEGKAYLGFSKKRNEKMTQTIQRECRKLKPACVSNYCKKSKVRNCSALSEIDRERLFSFFWNDMNWDQRKVYVASNVEKVPSKRKTTDGESRRQGTFLYFINNKTEKLQVCREMFLNTFGLGYKAVQDYVNKSTAGMHQHTKKRIATRERLPKKNTEYLEKFLDSLPKLPSHYARKDTMKLFLEPTFKNLVDVYKLYKSKCENENVHCLSKKIFTRIFKEKNLSVYALKKDQCNVCAEYKSGNISEVEWMNHRERKDRARREKETDKKSALRDECILLTVDLQAVKLCPSVNANAFYYKTKLCMHNFTVYNLRTHHAVCYWFSEDENSELKASTFTSCLLDYLQNFCITTEKKTVIIFSDGCTYQNRNNVMANAILNFSICTNIVVYQKYLEPGHTQMECDSVHAAIERKLKNREIHLPSEYLSATREARVNPTPYEVRSLEHTFFKDYSLSEYLRYTSIRPGRKAHDPVVTDIRCIMYKDDKIKIKLNFDQDFIDLPARPKLLDPILDYPRLHNQRCKISAVKYKHLQELKRVLPKDCHNVYDNIPHFD